MSKKTHLTRKTSEVPIIGQPKDISDFSVLPTKLDVLKYFEWVRNQLKLEGCYQPAKRVIAMRVALKIEELWKKASIPVCTTDNIRYMILKLHEQGEKLKKSSGGTRKHLKTYKVSVEKFKSNIVNNLFDICSCKCDLNNCHCPAAKKVPPIEREFLNDQRSIRIMTIGGCDKKQTKKLEKKIERKLKSFQSVINVSHQQTKNIELISESEPTVNKSDSESDSMSEKSSVDSDYDKSMLKTGNKKVPEILVKQELPQNLSLFSRACDRRAISSRTGAQLASALLKDLNVVTCENQAAVIDKSKIFRERIKSRQSASSTRTSELMALYFDGRKDDTIIKDVIAGKSVRKRVHEEHISLVEEPDSKYFGHVTPANGTGKEIVTSILKFLEESTVDGKTIKAIGCDGTATNTGALNGVITLFEKSLQHPLQAVVCLLHLIELPLRKVMCALDGPTTGPRSFSGPIGKKLLGCQDLPVVNFKEIESVLPSVDVNVLSTDQKYLYEISQAVTSGICSQELARRNPGNISHARWITMANRIMRLYIASDDPSPQLNKLVEFILKVYVPSWFTIKCQPAIIHACKHFFKVVQCSKNLDADLKLIVHSTLQRNAFMAHPEHLLLGMLFDKRKHIRVLACKRIHKARQTKTKGLRIFKPPQVNFYAEDYTDLIDWQSTSVTEPPLVTEISDQEIELIAETGVSERKEFKIPSHTQAVERIVKEVTEASKHVCGSKERDGFIRSRLLDRKHLPKFETKSNFKVTSMD